MSCGEYWLTLIAVLMPDFEGDVDGRVAVNIAKEVVNQGYAMDLVVFRALDKLRVTIGPVVRLSERRPVRANRVVPPLNRCLRPADTLLLFLGEGVSRPVLEAQVRQLGLDGQMLMPSVDGDAAPYQQSTYLRAPLPKGESFGDELFVTLVFCTLLVRTAFPCVQRETLTDCRFVRMVRVGDSAALAEAMLSSNAIVHDPKSLRARTRDFSIDKALGKTESHLISGQPG